ncbi:MAG: hypothetical protein CMK07_14695 [Ponticaulis sp.]|nr:hypothetical protein [Ponticaulis sp.]
MLITPSDSLNAVGHKIRLIPAAMAFHWWITGPPFTGLSFRAGLFYSIDALFSDIFFEVHRRILLSKFFS